MGKSCYLLKVLEQKKKSKASFFEPLSQIELVNHHKYSRELQVVSKVSFINYWSRILNDLRSVTLSMAILELTEKTLSYEDPHPDLFKVLKDVLNSINERESDPNLIFWFYECILLSYLGFKPNLDEINLPGIILPDLNEAPNRRLIL